MDTTSPLEMHPDFDFDVDLLAYQQDDMYLPLNFGQFTATEASEVSHKVASRISLACIPCRTRHVKCNAGTPSCSRCQSASRPCSYAKSKRGAQRSTVPRKQVTANSDWSPGLDVFDHPQYQSSDNMVATSFSSGATPETSTTLGSHSSFHDGGAYSSTQLLDMYYASFHDAHPILLPRGYLLSRLQTNPESLQHLTPVMEFIGSLYLPDILSEPLREIASVTLEAGKFPMTGFSVQALLLFALSMHCCNDFEEARVILDRAITLALEIKLHSRSFARENGEGNAVLEDSWRRTWWLLFIIDGIFSGIRHDKSFKLLTISTDVDLPCEEQEYAEGKIPMPKSLDEYDTREFAEEEVIFSSFTYLIDVARISGAVLPTSTEAGAPFDKAATNADARLVNWSVHLPKCKKEMIDKSRGMDEVIFQAHMLINVLKLYLHRPRSYLTYNCAEETSKCTPTPPVAQHMMRMGQSVHAFHTYKTLESLEALLGMITLPASILKHTPLIICGLAMAIMGQISACILVLEDNKILEARERIRLGIGALKVFTEVWPLAKKTIVEMKAIARELLNIRNAREDGTNGITTGIEMVLSCEK